MKWIVRTFILLATLAICGLPTGVFAAAGGSDTLVVSASTLTLTGAGPGNFAATLNGSDQQVYGTLGAYTATDKTGGGTGWNVTFQATPLACTSADTGCPAAGDTLPSSSLLMPPPTVACNAGTSCTGRASAPTISISVNTALDSGSAVKVASAPVNKGMGTYNFSPGTIGTGNLQLTVPSYAYATTYHSTLTVSVVSGP